MYHYCEDSLTSCALIAVSVVIREVLFGVNAKTVPAKEIAYLRFDYWRRI
jgi:hypothetical protein